MRFEKISFEQYRKDRKELNPLVAEEEIRKEYDNIKLPTRSTSGSCGYDFYVPYTIDFDRNYIVECIDSESMKQETRIIINPTTFLTGIRIVDEPGDPAWYLMLAPRSGLGWKYGTRLMNTTGVIDRDYCGSDNEGHIKVKMLVENAFTLEAGKAILQGIISPYLITSDDKADGIRNGGFGSTGV